jgi:hypothetical protein
MGVQEEKAAEEGAMFLLPNTRSAAGSRRLQAVLSVVVDALPGSGVSIKTTRGQVVGYRTI